MTFRFICGHCGPTTVSREEVEALISPDPVLSKSFQDRLGTTEKGDALEVAVWFKDCCPKCEPSEFYDIELKVLPIPTGQN